MADFVNPNDVPIGVAPEGMGGAPSNPISGLASGLQAGMQMRAQKQQMIYQRAKANFEQIKGESDKLGTMLTNKDIPEALLGPVYNQWAAYQKVLNPGMQLPGVKDITPEDGDIIKQAAQVVMFGKQNGVPSDKVNSALQDLFNNAQTHNTSKDFNKNFQDFMQTNMGKDLQTVKQGNTETQGFVNSFNQFNPLQVNGTPATSPNVPAVSQNFTEGVKRYDDLSKEFNSMPEVVDIKKAAGSINDMRAMVESNVKGIAGLIPQLLGHSVKDQRVTETDIPRYEASPDIVSSAKRAVNKIANGDLTNIDQKDYNNLLDVLQKAASSRMDKLLTSYITPLAPKDASPDQMSWLKQRIGSSSMADIPTNTFSSFDEARKAGLKPGTQITVGGKTYTFKGGSK